MTGYMIDSAGQSWTLPALTAWQLEYAAGTPCDSFWLRCAWEMGGEAKPEHWGRFVAEHEGERVFTGVVDECEVAQTSMGCRLEVSGRGMAALLLDNEALGVDYTLATQEDILRDHVKPYGIAVQSATPLPAVPHFSVANGSSEWSVVYEFARYWGGINPRFNRLGQLVLNDWEDQTEVILDHSAAVISIARRDKRYGVLSHIKVRDRYSGSVHTVKNDEFCFRGGQAGRVITMPGRSNFKAMRYSGQFQLDKSKADQISVEVTLAQPFAAWPGQLVRLQRDNWDWNGQYRIAQAVTGMNSDGYWTRLDLRTPDFVV